MFTRLIEGPYPNYDQVIPRDNNRVAIADRTALISALRRMSIIASDQTHTAFGSSFNAGMLKFSVQTPDLGEATDELAVRYTGDALRLSASTRTISLEILRYIPNGEVRHDVQGARARRDVGTRGLGRSVIVPVSSSSPAAACSTERAPSQEAGRDC